MPKDITTQIAMRATEAKCETATEAIKAMYEATTIATTTGTCEKSKCATTMGTNLTESASGTTMEEDTVVLKRFTITVLFLLHTHPLLAMEDIIIMHMPSTT